MHDANMLTYGKKKKRFKAEYTNNLLFNPTGNHELGFLTT